MKKNYLDDHHRSYKSKQLSNLTMPLTVPILNTVLCTSIEALTTGVTRSNKLDDNWSAVVNECVFSSGDLELSAIKVLTSNLYEMNTNGYF